MRLEQLSALLLGAIQYDYVLGQSIKECSVMH